VVGAQVGAQFYLAKRIVLVFLIDDSEVFGLCQPDLAIN
jgi:hypothetical protein